MDIEQAKELNETMKGILQTLQSMDQKMNGIKKENEVLIQIRGDLSELIHRSPGFTHEFSPEETIGCPPIP